MLGTDKDRTWRKTCRLTGYPIRLSDYLLEHIGIEKVLGKAPADLVPDKELVFASRGDRDTVVVDIQILIAHTLYPVKVHLDSIAVEGRQILLRDEVFVEDYLDLVFKSCGNLGRKGYDKEYLSCL